ncbi:MAG: DNA polymerase III subunit epsilon [Gammaproteobacteria bacterium]|jgi:DNA polymerase-3 subunit epsilon
MRQVVVDTETTGLDVSQGHRIIEIACVELVNRRRTERHFHQYLNPERRIDDGAFEVHGISDADLRNKPLFGDVAEPFLDFVRDAELIIHNAPFDVEFLNHELRLLGPEWGRLEDFCRVIDTLSMAREKHPGQKNNLDALCARYGVDNSQRDLHGALLDARLLLEVYLAMTGGQASLSLEEGMDEGRPRPAAALQAGDRTPLRVIRPNADEHRAHQERLEMIDRESGGRCLWRNGQNGPDQGS